jgi:DNA polymerase I-like protein with 3'-5' exonuclease and polymerase domains
LNWEEIILQKTNENREKVTEIHNISQKNRTNQAVLSEILREIATIKENNNAHMDARIDELGEQLKDTREELNAKFEKLDERIYALIGLVATSLLGIVISLLFGL